VIHTRNGKPLPGSAGGKSLDHCRQSSQISLAMTLSFDFVVRLMSPSYEQNH
jgi:hypothetical protein